MLIDDFVAMGSFICLLLLLLTIAEALKQKFSATFRLNRRNVRLGHNDFADFDLFFNIKLVLDQYCALIFIFLTFHFV